MAMGARRRHPRTSVPEHRLARPREVPARGPDAARAAGARGPAARYRRIPPSGAPRDVRGLPLIPGGADGVTKLLVVGAEELRRPARAAFGEGLHCGALAALVALKEVWPAALGGRLEFLLLMLTSVYGPVAVVALTAYSSRRLLARASTQRGRLEASVVAPSPRRKAGA